MSNLTFKQYRNIDISIFAILTLLSEGISTMATSKWFNLQAVAISTTFVFICIVMMRWGGFAAICAVLGGFVYCFVLGAEIHGYVIYCVGNCFALLAMLWFIVFKKDDVRRDIFKLLLFVISAYVSMQLGRWLVSLCFGGSLWNLVGYLATDIISLLFGAVLMLILRGAEGMIEDQKAFLFRLERLKKAEQEANHFTPGGDF